MSMRATFASLLLVCSLCAWAQDRPFVDKVPANLDRETVFDVVREALRFREWTVEPSGGDAMVVGFISSGKDDVRVTVRLVGTSLRYVAFSPSNGEPIGQSGRQARWVGLLQDDVATSLRSVSLAVTAVCRRLKCQDEPALAGV